ncbi:MAG: M56 family metallopeptidase [Candidatus Krumholzibacteria bacterium]|nr:M56 family metallopeptidase [Candidatus Krumholzibacteria bacterium]
MDGFFSTLMAGMPRYEILQLIAGVSLKGAMLCAAAGATTLMMRGSSAYTRKMIWVAAVAGLLLIPAMAPLTPMWNLGLLPAMADAPVSAGPDGDLSAVSGKEILVGPPSPAGTPSIDAAGRSGAIGLHWSEVVLLVWIAGAVVMMAWFLFTTAIAGRVARGAVPAGDRLRAVARATAAEIGLERPVRVLLSERVMTGITTGCADPAVILPSASTAWSEERLRLVLSHELAHVKRRDGWIELLAHSATVLHWFNPLAWLAVRRLRIERERDCDNAVLGCGVRPSAYASLLMDIAADLGSAARPAWEAVMISQGSNLKDRLLCILNPGVNRSTGGRRSAIVAGILVLSLVFPLSVSGIWQIQAQEKDDEDVRKVKIKREAEQKLTEEEMKKLQHEKQLTDEELKKLQLEKKMMMKEKTEAGEFPTDPKAKVEMTWQKIMEEGKGSSAAVEFAMALKKEGQEKAGAVLQKLQKMEQSGSSEYYFKESEFNTLGYVLLHNGKVEEAIYVFKNNVEMYPESWNVYDSLGEGLLVAGKLDKAQKFYEKSLALNPENENGKQMLAKIEQLREEEVAAKNTAR